MRRLRLTVATAAAIATIGAGVPTLVSLATADEGPRTRAGVAVVDATWHVGASAGQFTDEGIGSTDAHLDPTDPEGTLESPPEVTAVDPHGHTTKKRISDGVALRTSTRALVVEDTEGDRVAIVANDLYLAQDILNRRVASLIAEHDRLVSLGLKEGEVTGITHDNLAVTASHNHNTPFYSTPGWGTWVFQDVIDLRFYEYMAGRMAQAVIDASADLRPVRMGGATTTFNEITAHTYGPKPGDDGTPAGQPYSHTTGQLSVVKLDDVTDPADPKPYANWVVFGLHPEFTWGYDLINGDFTQAAARMVDRERGTRTVMSQRETGASGPHKDTRVHQPEERREFQDNGFAELDRGSRILADAIKATLDRIDAGTPERTSAWQPYVTDFDVEVTSQYFAPPSTRPIPGVSNCNTASLFHGDPRLPVLGLPDCYSVRHKEAKPLFEPMTPLFDAMTQVTAPMYAQLKAAGVPVPESYSATALTGVEETAAVHLMAVQLGDIAATFCPCEQFTDTALNIESRLDKVAGNIWKGWDWTTQKTPSGRDWCVPNADTTWTCAHPQAPWTDMAPISDLTYRRFRAQINNDAAGWEEDLATLGSEAEPDDPALIKGNFTHEEFPEQGFGMVLSVGMANDYWGYTPEYREMRSHDHYRKALNGLGLHGADFLATRLSRLAVSLKDPALAPALRPIDRAYTAEQARAQVVADGLGELARAYTAAYERTLPADGGTPAVVEQPADITRFQAAHLRFVGGSNYTDLPDVRVERLVDGGWQPYGDTTGDVQLMVDFPAPEEVPAWRAGQFSWTWTAAFEAFSSDISQADGTGAPRAQTPAGTYRFVVDGRHRPATADGGPGAATAAEPAAYHLESEPFTVAPWDGITVTDGRVERDGTVSFAVGPRSTHTFGTGHTYVVGPVDYPDAYASPFRFLDGKRRLFTYSSSDPARHQQYCSRCTFRPWADTGTVESVLVTVTRANRRTETVPATFDAATGRWRTALALKPGESAQVLPRAVTDGFGETNGKPSPLVVRVPGT